MKNTGFYSPKAALTLIIAVLTMSVLFFSGGLAMAQEEDRGFDQEQIIQSQLERLDLADLEHMVEGLNRDTGEFLPQINPRLFILQVVRGEETLSLGAVFQGLVRYLFREVVANSHLLGQLLLLAVIAALLDNIQRAFADNSISQVAYGVVFLVLLALSVQTFTIALDTGRQAIDSMVTFMQALLPLLLALLTAVGGIATAAIFHPLLIMAISILATIIKSTVFPLIYVAAILIIVSHMFPKISISRLASLIQEASVILLGLVICIFIGVLVVQGVTASVSDGVSMRTVKFLTGTFVPMVGKMFVDAIDTIVSCSLLLKNAVGVLGVAAVFFISSFPIVKLVSLIFIYKVTAAIIQPIADDRLVKCINSLANSLTVVMVAVSSVAIMFFIAITVVIGIGNMTVMLR